MIDHEKKYIFITINKTGGTSMQTSLRKKPVDPKHKHEQIQYYIDLTGDKFNDYFSFSVVRNPWDKMVSMYHFNIERFGRLQAINRRDRRAEECCNRKFADWVVDLPTIETWNKGEHATLRYTNQVKWLQDKNGKIRVKYIARFENIANEWKTILKKIGMPYKPLLHKNASKHRDYRSYYTTEESVEAVAQYFAEDIKEFGYKFCECLRW